MGTLFAQRRSLWSPTHYGMIWDILRFNRACKRDLARDSFAELTVDEYLQAHALGCAFRDRYLLPMAAAIWSCPPATMGGFPARSLAAFFYNHGLLDLANRPQWRTVVGGSHTYVRRMVQSLGEAVRTNSEVVRITRSDRDVSLTLADGTRQAFDQVVLAGHADQSLAILSDPTAEERALLSRFAYQANRAVLHSDTRLMPKDRKVWSSWNYLARTDSAARAASGVSVTYWMNRLQGLKTDQPFLVSLNPLSEPAPERVHAEMTYEHPVFDRAAMAAQGRLAELQGRRRTWFCGSYFGYGFHEDALRSAMTVAAALGAAPVWARPQPGEASAPRGPLRTPGLVIQPQES
jgi:predicted NAD/FAD-binding protein